MQLQGRVASSLTRRCSFRHSACAPRRALPLAARRQQRAVKTFSMIREWPDPDFIAEVREQFPEKMVASVEEARVLYSEDGYVYLDVRPDLELEEVGKVKGSVNIPLYIAKRVYDPQENKKVVKKTENPDFIKSVERKFPNKETKLLVACSDGTAYSLDALEMLDEAGYTNLVGLKGGYYAWFRVFDNKLNRRRGDGYTEDFSHDGDGCGIHGTGAGFARVDKIEAWVPPKY